MKRHRTALVGLGAIAETGHLPALLDHRAFDLCLLCDPREDRRKLFTRLSGGIPVVANPEEICGRDDIDAVVLALHPEISVPIARDLLRQGKAVLDEKPLAVSSEDALLLDGAATSPDSVYQAGFSFRHSAFAAKVLGLMPAIGTPCSVQLTLADERLDRTDPGHLARINQILSTSSVINHEGSHFFDLTRTWLGAKVHFVSACAQAIRTLPEFAGPNIWNVSLALDDNSLLQISVAWLIPEPGENRLTIIGPDGSLDVSLSTGKGCLLHRGRRRLLRLPRFTQGWHTQLDVFSRAITTRSAQGPTFADGLAVLRAAEACQLSLSTGRRIRILS